MEADSQPAFCQRRCCDCGTWSRQVSERCSAVHPGAPARQPVRPAGRGRRSATAVRRGVDGLLGWRSHTTGDHQRHHDPASAVYVITRNGRHHSPIHHFHGPECACVGVNTRAFPTLHCALHGVCVRVHVTEGVAHLRCAVILGTCVWTFGCAVTFRSRPTAQWWRLCKTRKCL